MSKILLVRVDARLIHGQIASKWSRVLNNSKFVVIDNGTANDAYMKKFFEMCSPAGTVTKIYTVDRAIELWNKNQFGTEGSTIVIFKDIKTACEAYEKGFKYSALDIGQVPGSVENRVPVLDSVNLNKTEADMLMNLKKDGVNVYVQGMPEPENRPVDIETAISKVVFKEEG